MSFLQPWLLAALPIIALPIVIHLINQRRYQTIQWATMMFLIAANRMSRGYARLRQWLILLFRMLAIAGLIFAVSRPLASGWLGVAAGGRADTTMILLDRSPSMQEERQGATGSKLETGRQQLVRTLKTLSSARWVLIESTKSTPVELESPEELLRLPAADPTSASAALPAMLQAAHDYIRSNQVGRTEVWICSDLRENDWGADDGRWQALRDSFSRSAQSVRFHLLAYPERSLENIAVRVSDVRRREIGDSAELVVSLSLTRGDVPSRAPGAEPPRISVPVQLEIEGARSEVTVEMAGSQLELKDHRIPLDKNRLRGWGRVSIPADANPADNDFYFVFDQPAARQTVVVAEDAQAARPLQLAAAISPDPELPSAAEIVAPEQLSTLDWEKASLLLWQAPLPAGDLAKNVQAFVERGAAAIFFPPRAPTTDELGGIRWGTWIESQDGLGIATWRGDQDLLAHTQSGAALPMGELAVRRYCTLAGDHTPLAALNGDASLLARATTARGGMYFCATTPAPADSSLAAGGIVLYVLVQRAISTGAAVLGNTRQLVAGDLSVQPGKGALTWRQVAGRPDALSTEYAYHAGVYAAGDKLVAVNCGQAEEAAAVLPDQRVAALFHGLDFARVDDQAGSFAALINEIWRPFLLAMIGALILEALLCLPRISPKAAAPAGATP